MMTTCQNCGSPVSIQSNFCGYCGSELFSYEIWNNVTRKMIPKLENHTYKIGVIREQKTISFSIRNTGVVTIGLHVEQHSQTLSTTSFLQIDNQKMLQQTINILPSGSETVDIDVHEEIIESIFQRIDDKKPQNDTFVRLVVYTSLYDVSKGDFETFFIDFHPISKEICFEHSHRILRFVDRDELHNFPLTLHLNNQDTQTQYFTKGFSFSDWREYPYIGNTFSPITNNEQFIKIDGSNLFQQNQINFPLELQILERKELKLFWNPDTIPKEGLCIFSTKIDLQSDAGEHVSTYVAGVIGTMPDVKIKTSHVIDEGRLFGPYKIYVENLGDLPLVIDRYEILDGDKKTLQMVHEFIIPRDLQEDTDLEDEVVQGIDDISPIAPHQKTWFHIEFNDSQRRTSERDATRIKRILRLHHYHAKRPFTDIEFEIQIEKTNTNEHAYLVIDFGTTSSMVQVVNTAQAGMNIIALDLEEKHAGVELESILLYPEEQSGDYQFVFGEQAVNQINIYPHNVVQSLKTIVNQNPLTEYYFIKVEKDMYGTENDFSVRMTAQELLQIFLQELKNRSERAYRELPEKEVNKLGLAKNLIFERAVFTHPVELKNFEPLYTAAKNVGLTLDNDVHFFRKDSCIDESSAALVSYIYSLFDSLPEEFEQIMVCVDIGGGTTDISLAEVTQVAEHPIMIGLFPSVGDELLGGDAVDKALSRYISQICAPIDPEDAELIELAYTSDVFEEFKKQAINYNSKLKKKDLEEFWDTGLSLRLYAEEIKIGLSSHNVVHKNLVKLNGRFQETNVTITRAEFDNVIQPLMSKLTALLDKLLKSTRCSVSQISTVLLTGKSSYIPKVQESIRNYFGGASNESTFVFPVFESDSNFHPKDCVSNGAGVWIKLKDNQTFEIYEKEIPPTFMYQDVRARMETIFSEENKVENIYRRTLKNMWRQSFKVFDANGRLYHEFSFEGLDAEISSFDIVFEKPELYIEIDGKKINTNR